MITLEIEKEKLLVQREYYLYQIKNLEFEICIEPIPEDESQIKEELSQAFSDLDKVNQVLSETSTNDHPSEKPPLCQNCLV